MLISRSELIMLHETVQRCFVKQYHFIKPKLTGQKIKEAAEYHDGIHGGAKGLMPDFSGLRPELAS